MFKRKYFHQIVVLAVVASVSGISVSRSARADDTELQDRTVDKAALTAQAEATADLQAMLQKYKNTDQEPTFLARLADIQQQSAAMQFRVAHGEARRLGKAVDLSNYHKVMGASIPTLDRLISKYPNYADISHSYYMRGKAYEEIGKISAAQKDYLYLVAKYPSVPETIPAYMSLGEFAVSANQHPQAIEFLKHVASHPEDSHYPHALYRMAWSYYNLHQIDLALSTSERLVDYYAKKGQLTASDQGTYDNILKDMPLFYFAGYEKGLASCQIDKTLPYFRKLDRDGSLGHMIVEYGNLLRSNDHDVDLVRWKDIVLAEESKRPESFEVLLTTFEYQVNRMRFVEAAASAQDIAKLYHRYEKTDAATHAQKLLLLASTEIQKSMLQDKDPAHQVQYAQELAAVYSAFTQVAGEDDPRVRTIHANLAETLFAIKDYDKATENYRWIVDRGHLSDKVVADASLKAIASRYESLRLRKLIPLELKAVALPAKDPNKVPALLGEWVEWIDTHVRKTGNPITNFQFEADRALYAQGEINLATKRMHDFALSNPKAPEAIPAATLVVDTTIASGSWEHLFEVTNEFLAVAEWRNTKFGTRLADLAADAKLKMAESFAKSKDYDAAMKQADEFADKYPRNEHLVDALTVAADSAVGSRNRAKAIHYYSKIAQSSPNTPIAAKALLVKVKIEEEKYAFSDAAGTYLTYLALPVAASKLSDQHRAEMRKRVLTYAWLSGDERLLQRVLSDKKICSKDLRSDCERYEALQYLNFKVTSKVAKAAARNAENPRASNRAIWAAIALENAGEFGISKRHALIRDLSNSWRDLDESSKLLLIQKISASVPHVYALERQSIGQSGRLQADERSITRRLQKIREMEASATEAAKLPWSRIRALVLNEVGSTYSDLSTGIRQLPYPKKLKTIADRQAYGRIVDQIVLPFDQKSYELRSEAFRLASQNAVEPEVYSAIARDFFQEDSIKPNGRKLVIPKQRTYADLDLSLVKDVDSNGSWRSVNPDTAEPAQVLRARWAAAIESRNWSQVTYFAQEAKEKNLLAPEVIGVAKAVSLASAGAKAEASMAFADLCRVRSGEKIREACSATKANL